MTSTTLATASQSGSEGGGSPLPAAPAGARQRPPRPPAAAAAAPQATCVRVRGGRSVSGRMGLAALGRRSAGLERRQRRQCRRRQALCARQGNCTCFSPITSYYTQPTHSPPRAARCARPPQQPPPLPSLGAPGAQLAPGRCPAACCTLPSCARGSAAAPGGFESHKGGRVSLKALRRLRRRCAAAPGGSRPLQQDRLQASICSAITYI